MYDFLLKNWHKLKFSLPVKTEKTEERKINPKYMQREINSRLENEGIGTKAQQALKLQHEQGKLERKAKSREQKEAENGCVARSQYIGSALYSAIFYNSNNKPIGMM